TVAVGDAVTLIVTVKGAGNVRSVETPALPALEGWKSYEPKTNVAVDVGEVVSGSKTVEWLIRPERPGKTVIPPLAIETFDPAAKRYAEIATLPIELAVSGDAVPAGPGAPAAGAPAGGVDNVIAAAIRPIRVRNRPGREAGLSFLHGPAFTA